MARRDPRKDPRRMARRMARRAPRRDPRREPWREPRISIDCERFRSMADIFEKINMIEKQIPRLQLGNSSNPYNYTIRVLYLVFFVIQSKCYTQQVRRTTVPRKHLSPYTLLSNVFGLNDALMD